MYVAVRIDLMRAALTAFYTIVQRYSNKRGWSQRAERAVFGVIGPDYENRFSYLKRCHAFRKLMNAGFPKALQKWVKPDGVIDDPVMNAAALVPLDDAVMNAVALVPLRKDGKFRIKEFAATVEQLVSEQSR